MILEAAIAAVSAMVVAGAGAAMTKIDSWYYGLAKPSWQPPDWAFGPVWTVILGLAAWSGVVAWEAAGNDRARNCVIGMFALNGLFNIGWNVFFFKLKRPDWALIETCFLWLSVLALVIGLARYSSFASLLIVPYLVWVTIASYLNYTIVRLNGPFGRAAA